MTVLRVRRALVPLALAVLAAGALAACGGSSDDDAGSAAPATGGGHAQTVSIALSDHGCDPANASIDAGPVTFDVTNAGSAKVTEFELQDADGAIVGEREDVVPGIDGSFTLDLQPGQYVLYCPNGDVERGTLTVAGMPAAAAASTGTP